MSETLTETTNADIIRTEAKPACILCGQQGAIIHRDLCDRLFGATGVWTLKKCPNADCGLVWLDPVPCDDELWKAYATYYTHHDLLIPTASVGKNTYHFVRDCYLALRYGYFAGLRQSRYKWLGLVMYLFPGRRADVDFSIMYLPSKPGGRLLEIGCGSGLMLKYMGSLGWQAEGIDVDPSAVANAQSKGLQVACGSLQDQGYLDNSFDAIMLSHVIEHVPDPGRLLAECYRILKPGGTLSIVTPNIASFGYSFFDTSYLHLDPPRHLVLYSDKTLRTLVRNAAFVEVKTTTTIRDAHALFFGSYAIRKRGNFAMGTQPGGSVKVLLLFLRCVEWGLLKIFPRRGEEISLIGIK